LPIKVSLLLVQVSARNFLAKQWNIPLLSFYSRLFGRHLCHRNSKKDIPIGHNGRDLRKAVGLATGKTEGHPSRIPGIEEKKFIT